MKKNIVVIISTSEKEKALTGMMYAVNAFKNLWVKDVKLFFFGPSQKLLTEDEDIRNYLEKYIELDRDPVSCKFISDRDNLTDDLEKLGVKTEYVGEMISNLINSGYIPMIF